MATGALAAFSVISAGTSLAAGFAGQDAAGREADLLNQQGLIARSEAEAEAERVGTQNRKFKKVQKLAFLKSGVSLFGSPLLVLEETEREGQKEVDAIRRRGFAQQTLFGRKAKIARGKGRQALIGGFTGALKSGLSFFGAPGGSTGGIGAIPSGGAAG